MSAALAREVLAALRAPTDEARELRREFAAALADELQIKPAAPEELLTLAEVALRFVGSKSHSKHGKAKGARAALQRRFDRARERGEVHPLDKMAVEEDGVRRWRRADVDKYIAELAVKP